jgi:transposase
MREAPTTSTDSTSTDSSPRFALGIDVGKKALEVTLLDQEGEVANTSVSNDSGGREVLLNWLEAWDASPEHTHACMEASGGFEEAVATLLHEEGYSVSLVNPRRIKGYADSQLRRSKTDSADASLLARYGQREDPRLWDPPTAAESRLRELTRARQALKKEKTRTENRLDEVEDEAVRNAYQDLLEEINEKISALEEEIEEHVEESPNLNDQCSLLDTIPGVGLQTAAIVVSELGSADRFESARQAAAYAGLVPSHHQSGTSIRGESKMSKVGNARLRSAMYFPAMTALRFNSAIKALGDRLEKRGKEEMVIIGAAMRKLLHICYGAGESDRPFDASLHPGTY